MEVLHDIFPAVLELPRFLVVGDVLGYTITAIGWLSGITHPVAGGRRGMVTR